MIQIKDKSNCCGCWACVQQCPKQCISMQVDEEGFLYPDVDTSTCIDCGLCEKVCPVINQKEERIPLQTFAAKNPDEEVRTQSSSGGIFSLIASYVIKRNGIIFGARFNDKWEVIHSYTDTESEIHKFRGSKYVQSQIGSSYNQAKTFLKQGRIVLFTGTPCQIAGLRLFLGKDYDNLLTMDFICHGVPSPGIFRKYLQEATNDNISNIKRINFRDKSKGWKKFCFLMEYEQSDGSKKTMIQQLDKNPFRKGFLSNLYLRPSCHKCPAKSLKSGSDITIGDFWGIQNVLPEFDDDKGTSVIIANTSKGDKLLNKLNIDKQVSDYDTIKSYNSSICHSPEIPANRKLFFASQKPIIKRIQIYGRKTTLHKRIIRKLATIIKRLQ